MCKTQKETPKNLVPTIRQVSPDEVKNYHQNIEMTIAWYPYENGVFERNKDNEWVVVKNETGKEGIIPVILIKYPETGDSIWLDMNTASEDLGMLLKHSLMTQEPISRPFTNFLEVATCTKCHPNDVEVDFNK
jgi:hypothetical protein